jgi:hypothetical protein
VLLMNVGFVYLLCNDGKNVLYTVHHRCATSCVERSINPV